MDTGLSNGIGSWSTDHAFEASYSGTLQQNDDLRIPARTKSVPVPVSKIIIDIQVAQTGVDVDFECYKDGALIGTATLPAGDLHVEEDITPDTIDPAEVITWVIAWTGTPAVLGITATMRLAQ